MPPDLFRRSHQHIPVWPLQKTPVLVPFTRAQVLIPLYLPLPAWISHAQTTPYLPTAALVPAPCLPECLYAHLGISTTHLHPHFSTFSRTCPGASAPHLFRCLQPASPSPPHLLLPAGQKSGQAEHPHLCRRRRSALPAPAAARTFMGRALPAPRFPAGNRAPGLPHGRAEPPLAACSRFPAR